MQLFAPPSPPQETIIPPRQANPDVAAREALRRRQPSRGREFFVLPPTGINTDTLRNGINVGSNDQ